MKELRETDVSSIKVIDDWCSLEELQYLIWSFEYDCDDKSLWEEVKQGEGHFPRQFSSYVYDSTCRSTQYIFVLRDKIVDTVKDILEYPTLLSSQSILEALVDTSFLDGIKFDEHYYEVILFLNDDYEGGELLFKDRDIMVTPRSGSLVIFPAKEWWTIKKVKGSSYKIRLKLTDKPEHREDDPYYQNDGYEFLESSEGIKKSKKCKGCVDEDEKQVIV